MANKKRKDGYIKMSFSIGGKRYYVYGKNREEVLNKLSQKREEIKNKIDSRINPTVEEYYEKRIEYKKNTVKPTTIVGLKTNKRSVCNEFIGSYDRKFGEIKLKEITSDDLFTLQRQLAQKYNANTVNHYMKCLSQIFNDAMKERIIVYNPFGLIHSLKDTKEKARDTIHRALTINEQTRFFGSELLENSFYKNILRLAVLTGMRSGELASLKHKDIRNGFIEVKRTTTKDEKGIVIIGEDTKTKAGMRNIPITSQIQEVLDDQRRLDKMYQRLYIIDFDRLIFVNKRGAFVKNSTLNREIKRICEHENIEPFCIHALRDTFATRAIENGMNPKTLQEILGHKDITTTMNLYCHALDDTKEKEMNKIIMVGV